MHFPSIYLYKENRRIEEQSLLRVFYSLSLPFRILFINGYYIAAAYLGEVHVFLYT